MGSAEEKQEEEDFNGPLSDRSCTDIIFLFLFAAFITGMGILSAKAYDEGNIELLIRGYDSYGNICGHENEPIEGVPNSGQDMTLKGNLLYLNPNDLATDTFVRTACVSSCPDQEYTNKQDIPLKFCLPGASQGDEYLCPDVPLYESSEILHRCTPEVLESGAREVVKQAQEITNLVGDDALENFAAEVKRSWREIIYITLVGIALSMAILVMMRFLAAVFVYFVYFLVIFGTIAATTYLWIKYVDEKDKLDNTPEELKTKEDEDNVTAFLIYSIVSTVFTSILLLVMLFMWSRVKLVVALFKEAGVVVMTMPFIVLQPFFTLIAVALFLVYWGVTTLYIVSCSK
ncbi:choline transporter-like protein 1 [Convolutriloba macropyga]|uniref:choline transporter-like protein 1 n=1 Tax=Convolutriloba macropyga TaxID=536237 RepID=UPI003F51FD77